MTLRLCLVAGLTLAITTATAHADIPPLPNYVAGLWFDAGHHYDRPAHIVMDPVSLYGCQDGTPNCKAAKAANVMGATIVSVDGVAGADPHAAFALPHPPNPIVVVFRRGDGGQVTVKFAPR